MATARQIDPNGKPRVPKPPNGGSTQRLIQQKIQSIDFARVECLIIDLHPGAFGTGVCAILDSIADGISLDGVCSLGPCSGM
jgi:hypothetical protein